MASRRRGLDPDEKALWEIVARSARPMHPKKSGLRDKADATKKGARKNDESHGGPQVVPSGPPMPGGVAPTPLFRIGEIGSGSAIRTAGASRSDGAKSDAPLRMDQKTFQSMIRGKSDPQSRIDLHGMTLAQAHPALLRFVLGAQSKGQRLVLVITGKGRSGQDEGLIPLRKGALRQQVPQWLRQPPLGPVVLQVAEAHRRHGGSGAFYVYLRKSR